jgi:hypothetical protein
LLKKMKQPEQRIHVKREGSFVNDAKAYAELKGLSWLVGALKRFRQLAILSLICLVSSYWFLREKRWIEIFQLDKGSILFSKSEVN